MKLLEVTIRRAELKEEYEHKIKEMFESVEEEPTDENGKGIDWYEDLGIPIPEDLKQKPSSNIFPITDEFFNFHIKTALIPLTEISYIAGDIDEGCEVILKNGDIIKSIEDEVDILYQIEHLTKQKFWQKLKQLFK